MENMLQVDRILAVVSDYTSLASYSTFKEYVSYSVKQNFEEQMQQRTYNKQL